MGKGRRAREERLSAKEATPELYVRDNGKKTKREFPWLTISVCAILLVVVGFLAWNLIEATGIINRSTVAVESDNYKINKNELKVYEFQATNYYSQQLYTEYFYYQYGMMQDTYGVTKTYSSAEQYASAMIQQYRSLGILEDQAYAYAREYLAFCEGSQVEKLANGKTYSLDDEEIKAQVDDYIDQLKEAASSAKLTLGGYISECMGDGVWESDVRSAMAKYFLSVTFSADLGEDISDKVTLEEITEYRDEHKSEFYSSKYNTYQLKDEDMKKYFEGIDDEKMPKTEEEIKSVICDYLFSKNYEELYKKHFTDKKIEDTDVEGTKAKILETIKANNGIDDCTKHFASAKDDGSYEDAAYDVVSAINSAVTTEVKNVKVDTSTTYTDPSSASATELQKWLFNKDRKVDEHTIIVNTTKGSDNKEIKSYNYYVTTAVMELDEEKTKNGGYILLKDDADTVENKKTAEEKANAMYDELAADPTPEKFEELVEKYSAGSTALYEKLSKKSLASEIADWFYDEDRAENDIDKIKAASGYYVTIYQDENDPTWQETAREKISSERLDAWYKEALETYHVTANTEAEETTASAPATTTAAAAATTTAAPAEETTSAPADVTEANTAEGTAAEGTEADTAEGTVAEGTAAESAAETTAAEAVTA